MPDLMDDSGSPQCTATAKSTGRRCTRAPVLGASVCRFHGGAAPQVREAGRRRVVEAEARAIAERLLIDHGDAEPVADPLDSLLRLARRLELATDSVGAIVNDLGTLVGRGPGGGQTVRPELLVWQGLLSELRMTLVAVARLDLDERLGKISAVQGAQVAAAFTHLVTSVITLVDADPDVRAQIHAAAVDVLTGLRDGRYAA